MATGIKPPHVAATALHTPIERVGAFIDKHVLAPLEGIGKGVAHVGKTVVQRGSAGVFDHVQRAFPPLAVVSHPDVVKHINAPAPMRGALNVLSASAENYYQGNRQTQQFMQEPVATMKAVEQHLGDALWRNPMETRDDVVKFFETLTPFTLMLPMRAMPAVPVITANSAGRVSSTGLPGVPATSARAAVPAVPMPAAEVSSHFGKGDVIHLKPGEWQVVSVERVPHGVQRPPTFQALPSPGVELPSFSSVSWPAEQAPLPDNVVPLPRSEGYRPTSPVPLIMKHGNPVLRFKGPSYLGRGVSDFVAMPGLPRGFMDALRTPPSDVLPTIDGLRDGPDVAEASKPAAHHFEGFSKPPAGVTSIVNRIPQWHRLNAPGLGNPAYAPLPVPKNYFPDGVAADFDPRWFSVHLKGGELTIKALGNNTFHLDAQGVLRYYVGGSTSSKNGVYAAVAGIINDLGVKGQVPSVVAVQTYSPLQGGALEGAIPTQALLSALGKNGARWQGFTPDDLRLVREQVSKQVQPTVTPSARVSAEEKQNILLEAAQDSLAKMPFADWVDTPLPVELAKLGGQDALVMTYGRKGINNGWKIPSVHDSSARYLSEGAQHLSSPEVLEVLDQYIKPIWQQPPPQAEFPSREFKSDVQRQGVVSEYSSPAGSITAVSKEGHLEYTTQVPNDPMGWNSEPMRRDDLRKGMIHGLLSHLNEEGYGASSWVVRLRAGDPDFQVYVDSLKTKQSPTTSLSNAMKLMGLQPSRVLQHTVKGESVLSIYFSDGRSLPQIHGDAVPRKF